MLRDSKSFTPVSCSWPKIVMYSVLIYIQGKLVPLLHKLVFRLWAELISHELLDACLWFCSLWPFCIRSLRDKVGIWPLHNSKNYSYNHPCETYTGTSSNISNNPDFPKVHIFKCGTTTEIQRASRYHVSCRASSIGWKIWNIAMWLLAPLLELRTFLS